MFINSCRIFYKEDSHDAIFPADRRWRSTDLWTNNDSKARPLACIDWNEVCDHEGNCSPSHQINEDNDKADVFLRLAANKSTTFNAIDYRGGSALDAQDKIRDDVSQPLHRDPPQWIMESWALFNASLARIQYDALDIANGTGWDKEPLYSPRTPESLRGNLCGITTFQLPKGYSNINTLTFLILLVPLVGFLAGIETDMEFSDKKKSSEYFDGLKLILVERLYVWAVTKLSNTHNSSSQDNASQGHPAISVSDQSGSSSTAPGNTRPQNYGTTNASGAAPQSPVHVQPTSPTAQTTDHSHSDH